MDRELYERNGAMNTSYEQCVELVGEGESLINEIYNRINYKNTPSEFKWTGTEYSRLNELISAVKGCIYYYDVQQKMHIHVIDLKMLKAQATIVYYSYEIYSPSKHFPYGTNKNRVSNKDLTDKVVKYVEKLMSL